MKILLVSSFLPFPLYSGGHVRLYNIIQRLAKHNEITLICEKRTYQTEEDRKAVEKTCHQVITVDRKKQWSLQNILRAIFSSYPFLLVGHQNQAMKKAIGDALQKENFDLIHVETFYVMHNLPKTSLPIVLVEHNVEYLVYQRFANKVFFLFKPFFMLDVKKIAHWEKIFWQQATKLVAVSEKEKKIMGRSDTVVVPNGVDSKAFPYIASTLKWQESEKRVLFIGDFRWVQNLDAVKYILEHVWPDFLRMKHDTIIKLWIVGKNIPEELEKKFSGESIIFDRNAPQNTAEIFQKAFVLLAPIHVGGGTSYKILEAMASGVPVVTTPLGSEGIQAKTNQSILVAEKHDEQIAALKALFTDKKLYETIAKNARTLIEENYTWETIVDTLEKVYQNTKKS